MAVIHKLIPNIIKIRFCFFESLKNNNLLQKISKKLQTYLETHHRIRLGLQSIGSCYKIYPQSETIITIYKWNI